jgi:hypothetical protein
MLETLNSNAGGIQAVATIVLVIITAWYAKTTRDLARVGQEQLHAARQASEMSRTSADVEVMSIARDLLGDVRQVTPHRIPEVETKMRKAAWKDRRDALLLSSIAAKPALHMHASAAVAALVEWDQVLTDAYAGRIPGEDSGARANELAATAMQHLRAIVV